MNARYLIAIIAATVAGSAAAESTYPWVDFSGYRGTRTHAEVQAELSAAGSGAAGQTEFADPVHAGPGKTRAEVRAELEQAYREGGDTSVRSPEFVEFGRLPSVRGRAQVRAGAAPDAVAPSANAGS